MPSTNSSIPQITLNTARRSPRSATGPSPSSPTASRVRRTQRSPNPSLSQALAAGYRHIDTAQAYGTELGVGRAIAALGIPRDEIYITSKLTNSNHAPDNVERSFDQTSDSRRRPA